MSKVKLVLVAVAAALSALCGVARSEIYEGVTTVHSITTRAAVHRQAVLAAHEPDPYAEGASSGVIAAAPQGGRAAVHAQAVAKAHDPLQSLDRRAFYRDTIPAQYSELKKPLSDEAAVGGKVPGRD